MVFNSGCHIYVETESIVSCALLWQLRIASLSFVGFTCVFDTICIKFNPLDKVSYIENECNYGFKYMTNKFNLNSVTCVILAWDAFDKTEIWKLKFEYEFIKLLNC